MATLTARGRNRLGAVAAIAGLLLVAVPAAAQSISRGMGLGLTLVGGAGGPPLDLIVSTPASAAYSFRKLRAAYGGKAVQLRRASDNAVLDIGFTATGDFDTAAATTHCAATTCFVAVRYDQTGNGRDVLQATAGLQPSYVAACLGALPCMQAATTAGQLLQAATTITPASGVVTLSAIANRSGGTGLCSPIRENGALNRMAAANTFANIWTLNGASGQIAQTPADGAWHSAQGVINGGASVFMVDGVDLAGTVTGSVVAGSPQEALGPSVATTCSFAESMFWDNYALTAGERAALTANQRTYWGF